MTAGSDLRVFAKREAQARALAAEVADRLRSAIAAKGSATLAVPGGTTPKTFLQALANEPLDWRAVHVTLTDERCVPADDTRANRRLVAETLLQGDAADAVFVPLHDGGETRDPDIAPAIARLRDAMLPLDVCVLGMGADMHTASLFPGGDHLDAALDPACSAPLMAMRVPEVPETRVTLTAPVIREAGRVFILIQGPDKRAALERALAADSARAAPVRVALDRPGPTAVVYAD